MRCAHQPLTRLRVGRSAYRAVTRAAARVLASAQTQGFDETHPSRLAAAIGAQGINKMSYQGLRARTADDESMRMFEVSKVRLADQGRVSEVLWAEVDGRTDREVGERALAPVAEVIDALHSGARVAAVFARHGGRRPERFFVVTKREDGGEEIGLDGASSLGRELGDIEPLDTDAATLVAAPASQLPARRSQATVFAVSRVALDAEGRVVSVLWGRVDTLKNDWASDEAVAPVHEVVQALRAGHAVFALFASAQGHLPQRRFVEVDYDDGRQTIALQGPATHEREVHDMDRLATNAPS